MTAVDMLSTLHVPHPAALEELAVAEATAVVFFCSPIHDGARIAASLHDAAGGAPVIGCTTAGEFSDVGTGVHGIAALALPRAKASRAAAALATYDAGVDAGIVGAIASSEKRLGARLRDRGHARRRRS